MIEAGKTALLYPSVPGVSEGLSEDPPEDPSESADIPQPENFIIIDSTWQEARKIFNRSAYLQTIPRIQLVSKASIYRLRRNQIENGLCSAECALELIRAYLPGEPGVCAQANSLEQAFKSEKIS
ncbi:hypothetical protein MNBD_GAMMA11-1660 [hydrothermal vent metagenome]|uniref:tRNA-uridine aminocarboxypropyltransferase n=1 Tax=hydrothermal vent metagenome TaxID=652676 RepID=A0A3B0XT52_9ZZZZ